MADPFYLSRAAVRELDRRAMDEFAVPGVVLMENAGRGAAEVLMRLNPGRGPVVVLCGPGNNGGDGFVIARHLDYHGWPVAVLPFEQDGTPEVGTARTVAAMADQLPAAARTNFEIVRRAKIGHLPGHGSAAEAVAAAVAAAGPGGWVVDALFGTGLSRPIRPPFDAVVAAVNAAGRPVLAIDVPSGLDADTGEPLGPAVRAAHTVTFVAPKLGFRNPAAAAYTGTVHVIDIGAPRALVDEYRRRA
jgi:NAD(P)H-hydrate epimerase